MTDCTYCGQQADSKEHIIATRFADLLPRDPRGFRRSGTSRTTSELRSTALRPNWPQAPRSSESTVSLPLSPLSTCSSRCLGSVMVRVSTAQNKLPFSRSRPSRRHTCRGPSRAHRRRGIVGVGGPPLQRETHGDDFRPCPNRAARRAKKR
jgi:hypothetical protein